MGKLLENRVAVVTGSGQGIGRGIAVYLAKQGAKVVTNNRRPGSTGFAFLENNELESLSIEDRDWINTLLGDYSGDAETTAEYIREQGGEAVAFFGDVSKYDVASHLIDKAIKSYGKIDILINTAGTFKFCPIEEMTEEIWENVFGVKPKAAFNCVRHAIPYMLEQKYGRIINCTSRAWQGDPLKHSHYAAANAAVVGFTRGLSNEVFHRGVMVNAFSPFARTRASFELAAYYIVKNPDNEKTKEFQKKMFERTPSPNDLGPVIAYLSSELAEGISGSVFSISGNSISLHREPDVEYRIEKPGALWTIEELKTRLPNTLFQNYRSRSADIPSAG